MSEAHKELELKSVRPKFVLRFARVLAPVLVIVPLLAQAQPKAISPQDISRIQQFTEFNSDWSQTDLFNLDRYITVRVNIERLQVPNRAGNVYLWFTLDEEQPFSRLEKLPTGQRYRATLQSTAAVKRLGVRERDFPRGVSAVIRGWPATRKNVTGSVLLVDDILIQGRGKRIALHGDNANMAEKRGSQATLE